MCKYDDVVDLLYSHYMRGTRISKTMNDEEIAQLLNSPNDEVRGQLAKLLVREAPSSYAVGLLCQLAQDDDATVRVEAIDSLSGFPCQESYCMLCHALEDEDELVRAYAAFGVASVGRHIAYNDARQALAKALTGGQTDRVLVNIHEGLYMLGMDSELEVLMELFDNDDYHIQCSVLHALNEIANAHNWSKINWFVEHIDVSTLPLAVLDAVDQVKLTCDLLQRTSSGPVC